MTIPNPEKAKYLWSPRNGIVMINTELKRRMCPWAIPCNRLDASDIKNDPMVTKVYSDEYDSSKAQAEADEATPKEEEITNVEDSFKVTLLAIKSSTNKDELVGIGADLGEKLTRNMNVSTMQERLCARIEKIKAVSEA